MPHLSTSFSSRTVTTTQLVITATLARTEALTGAKLCTCMISLPTCKIATCDRKIFLKLDLMKAFYYIHVHPDDVHETYFDLFEYLRTLFGLCNAELSFQLFLDAVLAGLPFVFVYIDDQLIAIPSQEEHLSHLCQVFKRVTELYKG